LRPISPGRFEGDDVTALAARHLITATEFDRMAEAGIFAPDERLELLEGEIIEMSPIGFQHAVVVRRLINLLARLLHEDEAIVDAQNPVGLGDLSEPQPDVVLYRPRSDFYAMAHPGPEDVLLLIEVADTSLAYDREVKLPIYAHHRIAEVWIADLRGKAVEVYRNPGRDGYAQTERLADPGSALSPRALPRLRLTVEQVVG
jgi:Uma2 family endonuclease